MNSTSVAIAVLLVEKGKGLGRSVLGKGLSEPLKRCGARCPTSALRDMPGDLALVLVPESAEVAGSMRPQRDESARSGAGSALTSRWQRAKLRFERAASGLLLSNAAEQVGLVGGGQTRAFAHHVGP